MNYYYFTLTCPLTSEQYAALMAYAEYIATLKMDNDGQSFEYTLIFDIDAYPGQSDPINQWLIDNNIELSN